ncbi:hypothetical protein HHK36_024134 [Tetracentron sinense]|uniref:Uncharacterized protein n=1 Tax=Tetracentron sinense TaxID=13715 RepID=A0A834YKC7_TETSI|nr:hypothetical protein HHK36_024134 [Tetracentron sinense]
MSTFLLSGATFDFCDQDINAIVICILASSGAMDNSDTRAFLRTFRQITECTREIILAVTNEPSLEPELIVTTVIIVGCSGEQVSQKHTFLSRLALRFPFVFSLLGRDNPQSNEPLPAQSLGNACPSEMINSSDTGEMPNMDSEDDTSEGLDMYSEELQTLLSRNYDEICALRESDSGDEKGDAGPSKSNKESFSNFYDPTTEGGPAFQREPLISWNVGPGFQIAQEWAKERAAVSGAAPVLENLCVYALPVGVKPCEESKDGPQFSTTEQRLEPKTLDDMNGKPPGTPKIPSWDALTDSGFEAVMDFYNAASTLLKGKYADVPQKQGLLSVRAASMLEAERDSQKKWSPIVEMRYRGGIYRGRCQGGLPEGKGRLSLVDGSIYDGMWRYGKRSGVGTFYFSNGDVFQGSWRDDAMHGKQPQMTKCLLSCRVGFIFTLGIDGLQTSGRERPMVKGASIQSLETSSLAISKMAGGMATSCALMLVEQGLLRFGMKVFLLAVNSWDSEIGAG